MPSISDIASTWRAKLKRVPVLFRVLVVITLLPLAEYALLVWISDTIGFTLTLLLLLSSGALGTWCVRQQGLTAWNRILQQVRQGEPVGESIFDGVLILLAGILLIMPGLLSDVVGAALLFPRARAWLRERLGQWLRRRAMLQFKAFHADGRVSVEDDVVEPPLEPAAEETPPIQTLDDQRGASGNPSSLPITTMPLSVTVNPRARSTSWL